MNNEKVGRRAIYAAASIVPGMFLAGQVVSQIYKHYNPSNVDINNGLAYLRQTLIASFGVALLLLTLSIYYAYSALRTNNPEQGKTAFRLIIAQISLFVILGLVRALFPTSS